MLRFDCVSVAVTQIAASKVRQRYRGRRGKVISAWTFWSWRKFLGFRISPHANQYSAAAWIDVSEVCLLDAWYYLCRTKDAPMHPDDFVDLFLEYDPDLPRHELVARQLHKIDEYLQQHHGGMTLENLCASISSQTKFANPPRP